MKIWTQMLVVGATLSLCLACGDDSQGKKDKKGKGDKAAKDSEGGGWASKLASAAKGKGGGQATKLPPKGGRTTAKAPKRGAGRARGFTKWKPLPVFLGDKLWDVSAIGGGHAIVLTNDNHVGITKDSGKNWHYQRLLHGSGLAAHGREGGPYFAVGKKGFVGWSRDGLEWIDLPRVTNKDLIDVVLNKQVAVAFSRGGVVITYGVSGKGFNLFELPRGKRPSRVVLWGERILLQVGREVWATTNVGRTWEPLPSPPPLPSPRLSYTSQGACGLGSIEKTWGMICSVKGEGFAPTARDVFVVNRDEVQHSGDRGKTWAVSRLPFTGIRKIGGFAGGPFFALGSRGNLARSSNGRDWKVVPLDSKPNLNDIHVQGNRALIVGSGGLTLLSKDRGKSWGGVDAGTKRNLTHIVKKGGALLLPVPGSLLVSRDGGSSWTEAEDKTAFGELPGRPGRRQPCEGVVPPQGGACRVSRKITSGASLPRARMFEFRGDFGIMGGLQGLTSVTVDGGRSWRNSFGLVIRGGIQDLQVKGNKVVVLGRRQIYVSPDGGKGWWKANLPARHGHLNRAFIDHDGTAYAAGEQGTLLKATGKLTRWYRLNVGASRWVNFFKVMRAGTALYVSGLRGELYRSSDKGRSWGVVYTGQSHPVVSMVSSKGMVLAVTTTWQGYWWTRSRGDSVLLQSRDGGRHFAVLCTLSTRGSGEDFRIDAQGRFVYHNLISADGGRTWSKRREHYWNGLIPVGDGSGRYIGYRKLRQKRDLFYIVDKDMKNYTLVESFYHENATIRCDPKSGCWMAAGSVLYRPF